MSDFSSENPIKPRLKENVDLTPYNTLGCRVTADHFLEITSPSQLIELFDIGLFRDHHPVILGGGSNVLLKENLNRPVLKISIPGIEIVDESETDVLLKVGAGVGWHELVKHCVDNGFGGIENLALIPGTTGAAPIQNIGAYGVEFESVMESLSAFNISSGEIETYTTEECNFGYRDSIFKRELKEKVVITDVTIRLTKKNHSINTKYYALRDYMEKKGIQNPGIADLFEAVVSIRRSKLPDPKLIGNAGSFFKNPIVDRVVFEKLQNNHADMPFYELNADSIKIPAGWLIEKAGWKGKIVGNVGTYENQALVIVNHGGATGDEIYRYAENIQASVREKFGIELQPEVNIIENRDS